MKHLVIGGDGCLGSALVRVLQETEQEVMWTSRRKTAVSLYGKPLALDLSGNIPELPSANVVYLVASIKGFEACEGKANTWVVNVDAPLSIAHKLWGKSFMVFISTDATEWSSASYARQKAHVELGVLMMGGAVIRPGRFGADTVGPLAQLVSYVGRKKIPGVHKWQAQ